MDAVALRAAFPVCGNAAYFNAGSCGPVSAVSVAAVADAYRAAAGEGRGADYFARTAALTAALRSRYAAVLRVPDERLALSTCTSEGIVRVLAGLPWHEGDEVVTAEGEHPGLEGPLAALAAQRGVRVRAVALADVADAVGPATKLVACSHVCWLDGSVAPTDGLRALGDDVLVLLDGAQGAGAVPIDLEALGADFYPFSGQKWLCGPVGTGGLAFGGRGLAALTATGPTYVNLAPPVYGGEARPWADARAHDTPALSAEQCAAAIAALDLLDDHGWPAVLERSHGLADQLAIALADRGRTVAARGTTTLVSWEEADPAATGASLLDAGVVLRDLPGTSYLRASVGAWNDESDLERLLAALA